MAQVKAQQPDGEVMALMLAVLALEHSSTNHEARRQAEPVIEALRARLPAELYDEYYAYGREADLNALVETLIADTIDDL